MSSICCIKPRSSRYMKVAKLCNFGYTNCKGRPNFVINSNEPSEARVAFPETSKQAVSRCCERQMKALGAGRKQS